MITSKKKFLQQVKENLYILFYFYLNYLQFNIRSNKKILIKNYFRILKFFFQLSLKH